MFVVELVPGAARQVLRAADWWRANRDKAPDAFEAEFEELVVRLEEYPRAVGAPVEQRPGVRRALMRRTRYCVYFEVAVERVTIVAVLHASRAAVARLSAPVEEDDD